MTTIETSPTDCPTWLNLDDVIAPDTRRQLEEHHRTVARTITSVRSVFENAQAALSQLEPALGELPEEGFNWIMGNTVYGDLDHLLRAAAALVAPDDVMTGGDLDAELAKAPAVNLTTDNVPTPPRWIDIDAAVPLDIRRQAFELIDLFRSAPADSLTVDQLEDARALCRHLDTFETPAYNALDATGVEDEHSTVDGALAVLSNFTGSLALHNAMSDYHHRSDIDDRYDPEEFMRPAEIAANT